MWAALKNLLLVRTWMELDRGSHVMLPRVSFLLGFSCSKVIRRTLANKLSPPPFRNSRMPDGSLVIKLAREEGRRREAKHLLNHLEEELLQCGGYNRTRPTKHIEAPILEVTAANHCAFVMLVPPKFLYSSNQRQSAECPPYGT